MSDYCFFASVAHYFYLLFEFDLISDLVLSFLPIENNLLPITKIHTLIFIGNHIRTIPLQPKVFS